MRSVWDGLRVDVLTPEFELIASFASPLEACRYAALIYEGSFEPVLRRRADGDEIRFTPQRSTVAVAEWVAGRMTTL